MNVATGELTLIMENPGNITQWMTDHEGKLRIAVTTDGVTSTVMHRATENDLFTPVITTNFRETLSPLFFHL